MRTKTLLLTAAVSAAGVASSMAQGTVFSVNAVGYVNSTIVAGPNKLTLLSNPLNATDNSINALFKGGISGTIPNNLTVFKFVGTRFETAQYDDVDANFGANGALTVAPGEGVFVRNPTASAINVTFVGEVPQGDLKNAYPKGLSVRASQVPQDITLTTANGFRAVNNDRVFIFDTVTQRYVTYQYDDIDGQFNGPGGTTLPAIKVGQAFFLNAANGGSWDRTFSVNN